MRVVRESNESVTGFPMAVVRATAAVGNAGNAADSFVNVYIAIDFIVLLCALAQKRANPFNAGDF